MLLVSDNVQNLASFFDVASSFRKRSIKLLWAAAVRSEVG
jgi:hypothetical protein